MTCQHNRFEGVIDLDDNIPIEGGGTTTVLLHICPKPCRGAIPFPKDNFELLSQETVENIEVKLQKQGIHLVEG